MSSGKFILHQLHLPLALQSFRGVAVCESHEASRMNYGHVQEGFLPHT